MDEPLNIQFAAFLLLESIRMYHFPFAFSEEDYLDFECMYCAKDT